MSKVGSILQYIKAKLGYLSLQRIRTNNSSSYTKIKQKGLFKQYESLIPDNKIRYITDNKNCVLSFKLIYV
jgi:hypothetical protein